MHKICLRKIGVSRNNRLVYYFKSVEPILGLLHVGVIDRGTNVLQIRPTTICPLNCIFCSVDAGPFSRSRWAEYIVSKESIVNTVYYVGKYKGPGLEALIDTVGDPLTYPYLVGLVRELKELPYVNVVAIETHGALLSKSIVDRLDEAGLDRINLSIDTLDREKAVFLQGVKWFDVKKVMDVAKYIVENTNIDLHVTPLWIPGINDKDVIEVVKWAVNIGAGKKWPPVTIQKYNVHKFGRKIPGVKPLSWSSFWRKLRELEKTIGVRLSWSMEEWGMKYMKKIPSPLRKGEVVLAKVIGRGWLRSEYLGYVPGKRRFVTIIGLPKNVYPENNGIEVFIRIVEDKDGIFIGRFIDKA